MADLDAPRRRVGLTAGAREFVLDLLPLRPEPTQRLLGSRDPVLDLREATRKHLILYLGIRDLVLEFRVGEGLLVRIALA